MSLGIGLDVVELDRIARGLERFGDRYLRKILTPTELRELPKRPVPYLAARFAAKEAASKALGTGFSRGVSVQSFEVLGGERGKPYLTAFGAAHEAAARMGGTTWHVSLTHGRDVASAVVILECLTG